MRVGIPGDVSAMLPPFAGQASVLDAVQPNPKHQLTMCRCERIIIFKSSKYEATR